MGKRVLGVLLVLLFAVVVSSVVQDFRFDLSTTQYHTAAATLERTVASVDLAIANLRAAQASYIAEGQGPDFWMKRATDVSSEVESRLMSLQAATTSDGARTHYDAALAAFGALEALDKKARAAIANTERLKASDLIFMDSVEPLQRLSAELQAARDAELAGTSVPLALARKSRLAMNGGATLVLFLAAVLFFQRIRVAAPPPAVPVAPAVPVVPVVKAPVNHAQDLAFRDSWPAHSVNLKDAAEVCVDMARVLDGRDVQPLLGRAANVLDAKGLILWVLDGSGVRLRPSVAHGYSDAVLQRLGSLDTAADNPTSLAFRSMQTQSIPSPSVGLTGAIAAPLITPSGCVGVLSAEVKKSAPSDDTLAVARMFAAQLATLVAPTPVAPQQAAEA